MSDKIAALDDSPNICQPDLVHANRGRRLSDKLLQVFHEACDQGKYDVAKQLLAIVETMVQKPHRNAEQPNRRKGIECLVAAYERLWHIQH